MNIFFIKKKLGMFEKGFCYSVECKLATRNTLIICGTSGSFRDNQFLLNREYVNFNAVCFSELRLVHAKKISCNIAI